MAQTKARKVETNSKAPSSGSQKIGPKLTPNEHMVYAKLVDLARSAGAYELLDQLRADGVAAIPTIYRALKGLERKGLVQHLISTKTYVVLENDPRENSMKLLLVCEQCATVMQAEEKDTLNVINENAQHSGFVIQSKHMELLGICPNCNEQGLSA